MNKDRYAETYDTGIVADNSAQTAATVFLRYRDEIAKILGCDRHLTLLQNEFHARSRAAGWWSDDPITPETVAVKLALIHSEISEALEGVRKDKMDDHLPHRKACEVELADAIIRILDLAGALGYDIGAAINEKMAYNASRADHKPENRAAPGGKVF